MEWVRWGVRALLLSGLLVSVAAFPVVVGTDEAPASDDRAERGDARVSGGMEVRDNSYPWTAQIKLPGNKMCGGALISCRAVVTAAHCVQPFYLSSMVSEGSVLLGNARKDVGKSFGISEVAIHPGYDASGFDSSVDNAIRNDIAIITLDEPTRIRPIGIAKTDPRVGSRGLVLGWGETESDSSSAVLRQTVLEVVGATACSTATGKQYFDPRSSICAGSPGMQPWESRRRRPSKGKPGRPGRPAKPARPARPTRPDEGEGVGEDSNQGKPSPSVGHESACQGDSGGPFIDPRSQKLWGVVSYAFGNKGASSCGEEERQTVLTSIRTSWSDFVQDHVNRDTCRRPS